MKKYFIPIFMLLILFTFTAFTGAQTEVKKNVDIIPTPVGGIYAIAKNVKYPESAKKAKIEGVVMLSAVIDKNGNPENIKVIKSVGHGCDEAAIYAVKETKFKPGILDGKPVATQITIPIKFKLK